MPHPVGTPHVLVQVNCLAAFNNSQGIPLQLHEDVAFVAVQASTQPQVCGVELSPIIEKIQCLLKVTLVHCFHAKLQHIQCKLLGFCVN